MSARSRPSSRRLTERRRPAASPAHRTLRVVTPAMSPGNGALRPAVGSGFAGGPASVQPAVDVQELVLAAGGRRRGAQITEWGSTADAGTWDAAAAFAELATDARRILDGP